MTLRVVTAIALGLLGSSANAQSPQRCITLEGKEFPCWGIQVNSPMPTCKRDETMVIVAGGRAMCATGLREADK